MNSLNTLEYNKLLALIARHAQTPMGKGYLENLEPLTSRIATRKRFTGNFRNNFAQ